MADDYLPFFAVDRDNITRLDPLIVVRQGRHSLAVARSALFKFGQMFGIQPVLAKLFDHETGTMPCHFMPDHMRGQKLAAGHP